jgi:hypothetical protein
VEVLYKFRVKKSSIIMHQPNIFGQFSKKWLFLRIRTILRLYQYTKMYKSLYSSICETKNRAQKAFLKS